MGLGISDSVYHRRTCRLHNTSHNAGHGSVIDGVVSTAQERAFALQPHGALKAGGRRHGMHEHMSMRALTMV